MHNGTMNPIQKAVDALGSQKALADACEQKPQAITRWLREAKPPAHHAITIERATKRKVTRYQLRPDVFGHGPKKRGR